MILDSSFVIALINPLDVNCGEAVALLASNPSKPRVLHEVSLAECLVRSSEKGATGDVLRFMESMGIVFEDSSGVSGALRVAEIRMKTKLPLPDCYVVDAALRLKLPLVSFDKKLNQVGREIGIELII